MVPGMQGEIDSPLRFEEFVTSITDEIEKTGKLQVKVSEGNTFIFYVSKEQHLPIGIMTKAQFLRMRAGQKGGLLA